MLGLAIAAVQHVHLRRAVPLVAGVGVDLRDRPAAPEVHADAAGGGPLAEHEVAVLLPPVARATPVVEAGDLAAPVHLPVDHVEDRVLPGIVVGERGDRLEGELGADVATAVAFDADRDLGAAGQADATPKTNTTINNRGGRR